MAFLSGIERCRRLLDADPNNSAALNLLGALLLATGRSDDAAHAFYRSLCVAPDDSLIHSNLLHALLECGDCSNQMLLDAHSSFGRRFDLSPTYFANDRSPNRVLKIGYVSDGFRAHAIPSFFEPILRNHDPEHFVVYCFSNASSEDAISRRLRRHADRWFDISVMRDEEVGGLIRQHQIDILVELGGHIGDNRLKVLAQGAAPVQISTWDYPCTAGSGNIGYHLTDWTICPSGVGRFFRERLVRLPSTAMCYQPPVSSPRVSALPALRNGFVTFAAFHRMSKINAGSIEMWAAAMRAVPNSRLLVHHIFEGRKRVSKEFRCDLENSLKRLGIASRRLRFIGALSQAEHLRLYWLVDLALDSFPYSGCTTTAESLWMGIPVVTLAGDRPSSRHSVTMLKALNLDKFVARSANDFPIIAREYSNSLNALASLRRSLRSRMVHSPLTDGAGYTKDVEGVYRKLWRRWVNTAPDDSTLDKSQALVKTCAKPDNGFHAENEAGD